jgi:BirA family biotin operon repressor/biotin-[acetyl-CoA-carboxylase] ligase
MQFPDDIINGISLKQITDKNYDIVTLGQEVHNSVLQRIENLQKGSFKEIFDEYNLHLYKKDCKVALKKDNIRFDTTIKKVNEHGQLITHDVMERVFNWGEVKWVV